MMPDRNLDIGDRFSSSVSPIDENLRLSFASRVLLGLFIMSAAVFAAHIWWPDNSAVTDVFELIKVGILPLVTLIISFYFPSKSGG